MKRFSQTLKNTLPMTTLVRNIPKIEKNHGDILQKTMLLYKSITEIIGLGIIGTGITGIFIEIEIIGDTVGDLVKVFTGIMSFSRISMGITEITCIMDFIILHITTSRFTETAGMPDISTIAMLEIIFTDREEPTIEGLTHTIVEDQTATLKETPPQLTAG